MRYPTLVEKRYNDEFKEQIVKLHEMGKKIYDLSSEYAINAVIIYKWIKETKPVIGGGISKKEYEKMQKELRQLRMKNEILKKLPPYSQENNKTNSKIHRKI
ncbi:transposase [Thermosipho sp. 1063]|uniref:transposase n=1 Tax=Thermosipho sp. 1063 TaxID=1462747 RepID=UPI0009FAA9EC|nr:transposase [Thermosipho sp. 1063]